MEDTRYFDVLSSSEGESTSQSEDSIDELLREYRPTFRLAEQLLGEEFSVCKSGSSASSEDELSYDRKDYEDILPFVTKGTIAELESKFEIIDSSTGLQIALATQALLVGITKGNMDKYELFQTAYDCGYNTETLIDFAVTYGSTKVIKWCHKNIPLDDHFKEFLRSKSFTVEDRDFAVRDSDEWSKLIN